MSWGARPTALPNIILGCWLVMSWAVSVAGEPVRVGLLALGSPPLAAVETVTRDLRALGYRHGENIALEARYAEGKLERLPVLAKELVDLPVHVIVAVDTRALVASKQATRAIPIVSASGGGDFVAMGLIADWDRPGGNVTGVNAPALEAVHKRLELFTHAMPSLVRLAVLVHAPSPANPQLWREVEVAAKARHVHVLPFYVSHSEDLEEAFQEAQHLGAQAVMTLYAPFFARHTTKIVALAAQANLPLAGGEPGLAAAGAVLQVGPDYNGCAAGAAAFVARILKGAKASELPVERCRQMVVVFNRKAAHVLGLTIDPTVTRGARVIE